MLLKWRKLVPRKWFRTIDHHFVIPWLLWRGWRPSGVTAVEPILTKCRFGFAEEDVIKLAMLTVCGNTVLSFERLATLWLQVRYLDHFAIPGSLVECGVWRGGATGMMALAHLASHPKPFRHLHLFDSFEGLPEPRADKDGDRALFNADGRNSGALRSIGNAVSPVEDSRGLIEERIGYQHDLVHYHVGWFQNTMPNDAPLLGEIAMLRLDGDWYDSTKVCLDYLYPLVVKNGVIVIDDYGYFEGCRRAVDEFLTAQAVPIMLHHIDETGRYWIKP